MSWTRGAAPPSTTPLLLTQMESELPYALWLSWMGNFKANEFTSASHSLPRCLEYLLRNDANPGIRDNQGYNAVHYASAYGHRLCLELVRNLKSHDRSMFLIFSSYCISVLFIRLLVKLL